MTIVFISGSRRIHRLSLDVRHRLDQIIEKRLPVVIGDANGTDKAVQRYLSSRGYDLVEIFCAGETPGNNVGDWPLRRVQPPHNNRDFDYYASKDRQMATEATVGFLIWDGRSQGTLMNVLRLVTLHKIAVVYVGPQKAFSEIRTRGDFDKLASGLTRRRRSGFMTRRYAKAFSSVTKSRLRFSCELSDSLRVPQIHELALPIVSLPSPGERYAKKSPALRPVRTSVDLAWRRDLVRVLPNSTETLPSCVQ